MAASSALSPVGFKVTGIGLRIGRLPAPVQRERGQQGQQQGKPPHGGRHRCHGGGAWREAYPKTVAPGFAARSRLRHCSAPYLRLSPSV